MTRRLIGFALITLFIALAPAAGNAAIDATQTSSEAIGKHIDFLREDGARLGLEAASRRFAEGQFSRGRAEVLDFMIGSQPVWLRFEVDNPGQAPLSRRLLIETAWLDHIDVYFRQPDGSLSHRTAGDALPFHQREITQRFFAFDQAFAPGRSTVFVRVATPDPMVLPIYLLDTKTAQARLETQAYAYGFIYGGIFALLAYNAILFISLRSARYLFYAVYLLAFLLMNAAYTGHAYEWLWPSSVHWQLWSNPVLMLCYAFAGITFALSFLETRTHFPRVHRAVLVLYLGVAVASFLLVAFDQYSSFLIQAFVMALVFASVMLFLGVISVAAGQRPARYFLAASFLAMVGAAMTALAVWGLIPFNAWTFHTLEPGMLLDAILLALALAYQFRLQQAEKLHAQELAKTDPLTGLNNRRAFYDAANPLWNAARRNGRDVSVILLDIDKFKAINDTFGHGLGDEVLMMTAKTLMQSARQGDISARWGGEEFILFLPETRHANAVALAERLLEAIAKLRVASASGVITFTASAGVAQRDGSHESLDALITLADNRLLEAKRWGRNRVCWGEPAETEG